MSNVIICVGISGSGKSTWAKEFVKNNHNYLRVNRDDIRTTLVGNLDGYYQREDLRSLETIVSKIQYNIIDRLKHHDYNIIIDNTHLRREYIQFIIDYIGPAHIIQFKLFDCDLNIAKNRVMERDIWKIAEDKYGQNTHDLTDEPQVAYIDKQYEQYQSIKKWLLEVYPDKIIL